MGKLAEATTLTRATIAAILQGISPAVFGQYRKNPEDFIHKAGQLINEQKATVIVEHLAYDPTGDALQRRYLHAGEAKEQDFTKAFKANRHIFDYVFTDSQGERKFVEELDAATKSSSTRNCRGASSSRRRWATTIPTGLSRSTRGRSSTSISSPRPKATLSSLQLRGIEEGKIACARKFFAEITSDQVTYDVVDGFGKLMEIVQG